MEALLLTHPDVTDAAVCGVNVEEEATEYPVGYITTDRPFRSHAALTEDVRRYTEARVAPYKRLRGGIHVIDAIPRKYVELPTLDKVAYLHYHWQSLGKGTAPLSASETR